MHCFSCFESEKGEGPCSKDVLSEECTTCMEDAKNFRGKNCVSCLGCLIEEYGLADAIAEMSPCEVPADSCDRCKGLRGTSGEIEDMCYYCDPGQPPEYTVFFKSDNFDKVYGTLQRFGLGDAEFCEAKAGDCSRFCDHGKKKG